MPKRIKFPYQYDPKKRSLSSLYRKGRLAIYFLDLSVSLSIMMLILFSGFNVDIRAFTVQYPAAPLLYGLILLLIFTALKLPLVFYSSYIYEHNFELSRYTKVLWFKDFLKINLISYVFSLLTVLILYLSINSFSPWWLYAGVFYFMFSLVTNYIYPIVILPFMWKVEPYKDNNMKERILNLCKKFGVRDVKNVVVIKESEKSVKPNAVFMGFGNSKKIGLFDNLLNNFTKDEIETVVGHELGHYVNKDIWRGLVLEVLLVFPVLFAVDYLVGAFSSTFGAGGVKDLAALPLIILSYKVLEFLSMPAVNTFSRRMESQADLFGLDSVRKPIAQISTEKRLADMHLSEISVHPLIEFWLFSHPSVDKRIKMVEEWKKKIKR